MKDAFCTSGSSPGNNPEPDFICQNHGSLFLLFPRSAPAKTWVQAHLQPDHLTFGNGVVIEPRFVWSILAGLLDDGLTVSR